VGSPAWCASRACASLTLAPARTLTLAPALAPTRAPTLTPSPSPSPSPSPNPEQVRGKPHVDFAKVEAIVPCLVRLLGIDDGEVRAA